MQILKILENAMRKPILLYDGDCKFCISQVEKLKKLVGDRVEYKSFQFSGESFSAIQLVMPDGKRYSGAEAIFKVLGLHWLYRHVPGFSWISEKVYQFVAKRRNCNNSSCPVN